ncbi:MAG: hypothetical protein ACRD2D_03005 [Terriglobales bacterium]
MASLTTRDHNQIQEWARRHDACPAVVSRTGGMLRFEFDPTSAGALREVDWGEFFQVFDEKGLELVYDDKPGSRFHKFAYPDAAAPRKTKTIKATGVRPSSSTRNKTTARAKSHHRKAA